jgi:hypothetical protein
LPFAELSLIFQNLPMVGRCGKSRAARHHLETFKVEGRE